MEFELGQEQPRAVVVNEKDNVATSLRTLKAGETVSLRVGSRGVEVKLTDDIIPGHKFAISDIEQGDRIIKFGQVIGAAKARIGAGAHVHVHNVRSLHGRVDEIGEA